MNVWRQGPITENPYRRTAFRVAMMPREVTERASIVDYISEAREIVNVAPESHKILGRQVTPEDLNDAETVLLKPEARICHELLAHATERASFDRLRKLESEAGDLMAEYAKAESSSKMAAFSPILLEFIRLYVKTACPSEPWFGALELELVPPFGEPERD